MLLGLIPHKKSIFKNIYNLNFTFQNHFFITLINIIRNINNFDFENKSPYWIKWRIHQTDPEYLVVDEILICELLLYISPSFYLQVNQYGPPEIQQFYINFNNKYILCKKLNQTRERKKERERGNPLKHSKNINE